MGEEAPLPICTVLCIGNGPDLLLLIQVILGLGSAVRVLGASHGNKGLDLAREEQPSLVLLNLHLPDHPGEEVLRQLKANERTRPIPVIVISGDLDAKLSARLLELGATQCLRKPFSHVHQRSRVPIGQRADDVTLFEPVQSIKSVRLGFEPVPAVHEVVQIIFRQTSDLLLGYQAIQALTLEVIEIRPGLLAGTYPFQRRSVGVQPAVHQTSPVGDHPAPAAKRHGLRGQTATLVHHGAKGVKEHGFDARERGRIVDAGMSRHGHGILGGVDECQKVKGR